MPKYTFTVQLAGGRVSHLARLHSGGPRVITACRKVGIPTVTESALPLCAKCAAFPNPIQQHTLCVETNHPVGAGTSPAPTPDQTGDPVDANTGADPMTPRVARVRLAQYEERTSTWSTATYDSGAEKALHQIAVTLNGEARRLREENARLRARVADLATWECDREGHAIPHSRDCAAFVRETSTS